jgi:hypothetical protein
MLSTCGTGRHTWLDPHSADRCCNPSWAKHLVIYGPDAQPQPGDRPIPDLPGTAWRWVAVLHPQVEPAASDLSHEIPLD